MKVTPFRNMVRKVFTHKTAPKGTAKTPEKEVNMLVPPSLLPKKGDMAPSVLKKTAKAPEKEVNMLVPPSLLPKKGDMAPLPKFLDRFF